MYNLQYFKESIDQINNLRAYSDLSPHLVGRPRGTQIGVQGTQRALKLYGVFT